MTKDKFELLKDSLLRRNYNWYYQNLNGEDYILGKAFHSADNHWEEDRSCYQILISVYDWGVNDKSFSKVSEEMRNIVGLEIHIIVSRTFMERKEFVMLWKEDTDIEEVERIAESFYHWVSSTWLEPTDR